MNTNTRLVRGFCLSLALLASALALPALAETKPTGFALDRYNPAERGSEWFAGESLDFRGEMRPWFGLVADYGYLPLAVYEGDGTLRDAIVKHQLVGHLGGTLVLWERARIGVSAPLYLVNKGDGGYLDGVTYPMSSEAGLGDVRLGLDARLLGQYGDAFVLALGVQGFLPTGNKEAFRGDGAMRLQPRLMAAGDAGALAWSAQVGTVWHAEAEAFAGVKRGLDLSFAAAVGARLLERKLVIGPEVYGYATLAEFGDSLATPMDAILGAHLSLGGGWRVGLGGGIGLTNGLGTPKARGLFSIDWAPEVKPPVLDRDGDTIPDGQDACPDVKGVANADAKKHGCPPDRDGDGILDKDDACIDVPGSASADPKKNGCPADRDGDGVYDNVDACPDVPGVADPSPGRNGCPPDQDGDGITDKQDACVDVPGSPSDDPKKNGCPSDRDGDGVYDPDDNCPDTKGLKELAGCPDRDTDGIIDSEDKCPSDPGKKEYQGCPDTDSDTIIDPEDKCPDIPGTKALQGCPEQKITVTKEKVYIADKINFETAKAKIKPESFPLLKEVAKVLREHPEITKLRVEGHTDNVGKPKDNIKLSKARAASVVQFLVKEGVAKGRLTSDGFGDTKPVASNDTDEGKARNRRVEFFVAERTD